MKSILVSAIALGALSLSVVLPSCSSSGSGRIRGEIQGVPFRADLRWGRGQANAPDGFSRACNAQVMGQTVEIWKKPGSNETWIRDPDGDFHPLIGGTFECPQATPQPGPRAQSRLQREDVIVVARRVDLVEVGSGAFSFDTSSNLAMGFLDVNDPSRTFAAFDPEFNVTQSDADSYSGSGTVDAALTTLLLNGVREVDDDATGNTLVIDARYSLAYVVDSTGATVPGTLKFIPTP